MSINKFIPLKDIIYNAFEDMAIDINHDFPTFKRWALAAETEISSFYSLKKETVVLVVCGCVATLPQKARIVRAVVAGDCGCDCGDLIDNLLTWATGQTAFNPGQVFLSVDVPDMSRPLFTGLKYNIVDNQLVFSQNLDGQSITVQFRGLHEDCNGELMVNENHEEAIGLYLEYRFCRRSQYSANKIERSVTKSLQIDWMMERDHARATDAKLSPSERADIVEMLHDPYAGWGLQVGMNNPSDDNYGR